MNYELLAQYDHVYNKDFNAIDIREHLRTLRELSSECEIVTEFGFRLGASFTALLMGEPDTLRTYDIHIPLDAKEGLTKLSGDTVVEFIQASTLDVYIPMTDLLFIDTLHTYDQLKQELELHGDRVKKYLVFHDTYTYGLKGEDGTSPGLLQAILEFMEKNHIWKIHKSYYNNNGLLILKRG